MSNRLSGLAVVGYGLTLIGFIQVAVTIAPHIADTVPAAGGAAPAIGVAVALAIDACWATLIHTTMGTYKTGQRRAAYGFGAATAVAVVVSTILLAAVGHMGPWSAVPVLAALLLVADGVRDQVTVSADTAATIRARNAEIRDARALAIVEARHDAHGETINGFRESARLSARTAALAEIKVTVQKADHAATRRIEKATARYGEPVELPATPKRATPPKPATPAVASLSLVATGPDDIDSRIRELVAQGKPPAVIASELDMHRATVYRRIAKIKEA